MSQISQRRIAADIMKFGKNRLWIDPENLELVEGAITREEVRRLIHEGIIKKRREQGISKGRKLRATGKGQGRRKGTRIDEKRVWIVRVRKQRKRIHELKEAKKLTTSAYRKIYMMVKGGAFRSLAHLNEYLEANKLVKRR